MNYVINVNYDCVICNCVAMLQGALHSMHAMTVCSERFSSLFSQPFLNLGLIYGEGKGFRVRLAGL